jgi:LuxR family maltose regulon positive regulatory protein
VSDVNRDTRFITGPRRPLHQGAISTSSEVVPRAGGEVFEPPRIPARLVERGALFRRLDRWAPVTVIEALRGFGKTTLVAEWARSKRSTGARVVWLRASPALDHPPTLAARLREGLLHAGAVQHAANTDNRRHDVDPDSDWIAELAMSPVPVIVVIDDADLLSDASVLDRLLDVVARADPVHLIACCAMQHAIHVAAENRGLETNVLAGGDLSVSAEDLPDFAAAWGHRVDAGAARLLHDLVGGWLLPLRLVLDATPPWADAFATHVAHEFLLDRVLPGLGDRVELSQAMRLAVPVSLDASLADALLGGHERDDRGAAGELAIAGLERQGLLWRVPRRDGAAAWRYPTLVRRALLERFEQSTPEQAARAHCEVTRALVTRRDASASELLRHARAASDWSLLERLWSERGWSLAGADPEAFAFAYADIPPAATAELGSLVLAGTLGDALTGTADDTEWMRRVDALLRRYMQAGTDFVKNTTSPQSHRQLADMLTAAMIAHRTEGRLEEALGLAAAAEREFERARVADPKRPRNSQNAWFQLQRGITQVSSGRYAAALELATAAYQLSPNNLVGSGATGLVAAMHAISGHTGDAKHWLATHDAIDVSDDWAAGLAQLPARVARAMLALDRLDAQAAEAELEATMLGSEASGLWPFVITVHTRYALLFGDPNAMHARLDHLGRVLARHLRHGVGRQVFDRCSVELMLALGEVNRVHTRLGDTNDLPSWLVTPCARFHRMTGDATTAAQIASAGAWRRDIHVRDQLQLLIIKALALQDLGKHKESTASFQRAGALWADTGNIEPFLLIPREDRATMMESAGIRLEPETESAIRQVRAIFPDHAELVQLSPRELEVLRQMQHHDTVSDLATNLSVSVNTVKKQLVSLYAKLDVHDRASAMLRAQRLGFLGDQATAAPDPV